MVTRQCQPAQALIQLLLERAALSPGTATPYTDSDKSADQRESNRTAVAGKERLRAEREGALELDRPEFDKFEGQSATIGEEHANTRAQLAVLESSNLQDRPGRDLCKVC